MHLSILVTYGSREFSDADTPEFALVISFVQDPSEVYGHVVNSRSRVSFSSVKTQKPDNSVKLCHSRPLVSATLPDHTLDFERTNLTLI